MLVRESTYQLRISEARELLYVCGPSWLSGCCFDVTRTRAKNIFLEKLTFLNSYCHSP